MGRHQSVITEVVYRSAKLALKNLREVNSRESMRLKAIISAYKHGITLASKILEISPKAIREWSRRFKLEGLQGLKYRSGRGRNCNVHNSKHLEIKDWLVQDPSMTLKEIVIKLREKFDIKTSMPAMHRILKKLGLAYITPRPVHYKQKKEDREKFKKKSIRIT